MKTLMIFAAVLIFVLFCVADLTSSTSPPIRKLRKRLYIPPVYPPFPNQPNRHPLNEFTHLYKKHGRPRTNQNLFFSTDLQLTRIMSEIKTNVTVFATVVKAMQEAVSSLQGQVVTLQYTLEDLCPKIQDSRPMESVDTENDDSDQGIMEEEPPFFQKKRPVTGESNMPSYEPSECSTFDEEFQQSCDHLMNKFDSNVDKIVDKIDSLSSKLSCTSNDLHPSIGEPSAIGVESETPHAPSPPTGEEGIPASMS